MRVNDEGGVVLNDVELSAVAARVAAAVVRSSLGDLWEWHFPMLAEGQVDELEDCMTLLCEKLESDAYSMIYHSQRDPALLAVMAALS